MIFRVIRALRIRIRWTRARQIEHLRTMLLADHQWLASDRTADALTSRYLAALAPDWYARGHEDTASLRSRLGLVPPGGYDPGPAAPPREPAQTHSLSADEVDVFDAVHRRTTKLIVPNTLPVEVLAAAEPDIVVHDRGPSRRVKLSSPREPLTKEQIDFILSDAFLAANGSVYSTRIYDFVRAVEGAHGIGEAKGGE